MEENKITLLVKECQKCIDELLKQGYTEEQILEKIKNYNGKNQRRFQRR